MYLLAITTLSEFEIRFKIVHKQLFMELTERSGSRQASRNTFIS
jgi:hypothetical protein